jgi:hypothetical protein
MAFQKERRVLQVKLVVPFVFRSQLSFECLLPGCLVKDDVFRLTCFAPILQ